MGLVMGDLAVVIMVSEGGLLTSAGLGSLRPRHRPLSRRAVLITMWRRRRKPLSIRLWHHVTVPDQRSLQVATITRLYGRVGGLLQARARAGDEDIPTPRVNLMRPTAALLRLAEESEQGLVKDANSPVVQARFLALS